MRRIKKQLSKEPAGGALLMVAMGIAMAMANSHWLPLYQYILSLPFSIQLGDYALSKPLLLWVNDGLMAVFFLMVGLEVKREVLIGELAKPKRMILPAVAALGGMLVPAIIYAAMNMGNPEAMKGWAIPTATDIAFALGVLSLLGDRVPVVLKLFLMTLAVIDDLGAVLIIAVFYTEDVSSAALMAAMGALFVLVAMNLLHIRKILPYLLVGLVLWMAVLKSGVHATVAGVLLAFTIPLSQSGRLEASPLIVLEHALHPWVNNLILPIFAFMNAGIALGAISASQLLGPVPLGIMAGLFVGKQLGVFVFTWLAIRFLGAEKPTGVSWLTLYGIAVLTGIGFTMSLFIDALAFGDEVSFGGADRLAVLLASFLSAIVGYVLLRISLVNEKSNDVENP